MNRYFTSITAIATFILCSCNQAPIKQSTIVSIDTTVKAAPAAAAPDYKRFGERLKISGDFNGDGNKDTIFESYISTLTKNETFKTFDSTDWEENIGLIIQNKPACRLYSNITGVDTLLVTNEPQQSGIALFENLGDLNNDNGDELGYIINWADDSNLNTYHILTLTKEKKWKELLAFPINELVNYEPENLFNGKDLIIKDGLNKIKYKFYSSSANVKQGENNFSN